MSSELVVLKALVLLRHERLQVQVRHEKERSSTNDYQMLYVTNPVFSSGKWGLYGIILCEFVLIVKSYPSHLLPPS